MNPNINHGPATIYQFPVGGRAGLRENRGIAQPSTGANGPRVNEAAVGESWYHAAAIEEAKRNSDH